MSIDINTIRTDLGTNTITIESGEGLTQAMLRVLKAKKPDEYTTITKEFRQALYTLAKEYAGDKVDEKIHVGKSFVLSGGKTAPTAQVDSTGGGLVTPPSTNTAEVTTSNSPVSTPADKTLTQKAFAGVGTVVNAVVPAANATTLPAGPAVSTQVQTGGAEKPKENISTISTDISLALAAVRDEIREAKLTFSAKWKNKDEKIKIINDIDTLINNPPDTDLAYIDKAIQILHTAYTAGIINKTQYIPLADIAKAYTPEKIKTASISIIRASNGTQQMHQLFYNRYTKDIDTAKNKFTQTEKTKIDTETLKILGKMDHSLSKMAAVEWDKNGAEIQKKDSSMNLLVYTKLLKEGYTESIKEKLEMTLAVQKVGEDTWKKKDVALWQEYDQAVDPMDKWWTISDETSTGIVNLVVYDLTSMLVSGGVAGLVGRVAYAGVRGMLGTARMTQIGLGAGKLNAGVRTVGAVSRAGVEGVTMTAVHAGVRSQEWFMNQPDAIQQIVMNSLGFGLFRSANSGTINNMFKGIENPIVNNLLKNNLLKQGLVVPGIITGVQMGVFNFDRIKNNDPSVWNEVWSYFLLNAAMGGMLAKGPNTVSAGSIQVNGKPVPMRQNADGTITLTVPGPKNVPTDISFKPSKAVEKELAKLNVSSVPASVSTPAVTSTQKVKPTGPTPPVLSKKLNPTDVAANRALDDVARIPSVDARLGITMTQKQIDALKQAHEIPLAGENITQGELLKKGRILKEAFTPEQRNILLKEGYAAVPHTAASAPAAAPTAGTNSNMSWKDVLEPGDKRRFREIFPTANTPGVGPILEKMLGPDVGKMWTKELLLHPQKMEQAKAVLTWLNKQTFSDIIGQLRAPWQKDHNILTKLADNVGTLLVSGKSFSANGMGALLPSKTRIGVAGLAITGDILGRDKKEYPNFAAYAGNKFRTYNDFTQAGPEHMYWEYKKLVSLNMFAYIMANPIDSIVLPAAEIFKIVASMITPPSTPLGKKHL